MLLVLIVILAALGHVVLWVAMPLLLIALLVAAVMFATGRLRRPGSHQDR